MTKQPALLIALAPNQRVVAMQRERCSRGSVYTVRDRQGQWLLLAQRLSTVAQVINEQIATHEFDMVNASSLYEAKDKRQECGYHKRTWAVDRHASFEETLGAFERRRPAPAL